MGTAIVGAGGHGRVAFECLELSQTTAEEIVYFDDEWQALGEVDGIPVLGPVSALLEDDRFERVFVGIGDNRIRRRISLGLLAAGKSLVTIVHPATTISPRATLGEGTIAIAGAVANRGARVGHGAILNTLCSVGHDCIVGDYAQVSPGANLGGAACLDEGVFLGIGVRLVPEVRVGAWSVVGAGAVVLEDVPERSFCIGVPARVVRRLRDDELPTVEG